MENILREFILLLLKDERFIKSMILYCANTILVVGNMAPFAGGGRKIQFSYYKATSRCC